jgi:mannose-6-phosphate isomerase-like protein (cupin superfamily)
LPKPWAVLPGPQGERSVAVLDHGRYNWKVYAPRGTDLQQPHTRDELYVVASGSGEFVTANERIPFAAGDALFVAAHAAHRFENFSADFVVWVVFYGPEGGE